MGIFNNQKLANSKTCICIKYKIALNAKELEQIQYLTENYVCTESLGKKILYLPEKNKQYIVDIESKSLKELDLSAQMMQMNQIKVMIGAITENVVQDGEIRNISISNNPESPAKLKVNLQIIKYAELEKTAFDVLNQFNQSIQLYSLSLNKNEIVKLAESVFTINGQEQKSTLMLTEIKNSMENIETIDEYCNYKIVK